MPATWGSTLVALTAALATSPAFACLVLVGVCTATWSASGHAALQLRLDRVRASEAMRRARDARETRLEEAGASRTGLAALTDLVDTVVAANYTCACELEDVLDTYVELTISACRLRQLIAAAALPRAATTGTSLHDAVVRRRIAQVDAWRRRCETIEELLDAITTRIRVLAEQVSA